jgi:hypothetical protein
MSPTKKMFLLSIVPTVLLISCAIGTLGKKNDLATVADANSDAKVIQRGPASVRKIRLLTAKEIHKIPAKKVYAYYQKIYTFLGEMERFQSQNKNYSPRKKSAAVFQFLDESFAGTETPSPYSLGNDCLIGGYWGTWVKKAVVHNGTTTYRMTCDSPNRCDIPGAGAPGTGHKCNPKFFTYMDADANPPQAFCSDLKKDLTTSNCRTMVETFYKEQGKASFADHFKRGLEKAVATDSKYNGNQQAYLDEVNSEYGRISDYCGPTPADWNKHTAGQNFSCFPLMQQYNEITSAIAEVDQTGGNIPADVPTPTPRPEQIPSGSGLGPFACIQDGLKKTGHPGVSNKYIAMLAMAAKYRSDNQFILFQNRNNRAISRIISTLTDLGLCKSRLYEFNGSEAAESEAILNIEKFDRNSFTPGQYETMFGYPWSPMPNNQNWESMTPSKRRASFNSVRPINPVQSCVANSRYKITKKDCAEMFKSCKLSTGYCNDYTSDSDGGGHGSGNGNGNNGGNTDGGGSTTGGNTTGGGTTGGSTTGGSTSGGNDNGSHGEVGSGSNAESGHGADNGAGVGSGPPGS